jgi:predicted methyltransferase
MEHRMSDVRVADALSRLEQHANLHLPLRRGDLLGRLALRFLWRRQQKWQIETNLAARDAVSALSDEVRATEGQFQRWLADHGELVRAESLHRELESLYRNDQNLAAGLNQRLYSAVGGLQGQLSTLALQVTDSAERSDGVEARIKELEAQLAQVLAAAEQARLRHVQVDLFLDRARRESTTDTTPAVADPVPDRDSFLEVAVEALLDGSAERARDAVRAYLPVVEEARKAGATGAVLDMAPGRGGWPEVLAAAGVRYRTASRNALVRKQCAAVDVQVADADPMRLLEEATPGSLGAITAFRFAERLEPAVLARFAELAATALQPGGPLLVETPLASPDFHLDPFALRPVHPDFLRFLTEAAGFSHVEVRLPGEAGIPAGDPAGRDRYCLLAWR